MVDFKDSRSAKALELAERALKAGHHERSLQVLAEMDGYEAWSGVPCGTGSRQLIANTISAVRKAQQRQQSSVA